VAPAGHRPPGAAPVTTPRRSNLLSGTFYNPMPLLHILVLLPEPSHPSLGFLAGSPPRPTAESQPFASADPPTRPQTSPLALSSQSFCQPSWWPSSYSAIDTGPPRGSPGGGSGSVASPGAQRVLRLRRMGGRRPRKRSRHQRARPIELSEARPWDNCWGFCRSPNVTCRGKPLIVVSKLV